MSAALPLPLAPDLEASLRRLKLARIRALAPEILHTAKTQCWTPEEVLRTLIEAEVAARDEANAHARFPQAHFPVLKTLAEFQLAQSAVPSATFASLSSLEWVRAAENLCLVGPSGTGKSHLLLALGAAAVAAGQRVRYLVRRRWSKHSIVASLTTRSDASSTGSYGMICSSSTRWASHRSTRWARNCSSAWLPRRTNAVVWPSPAIGPSISGVTFFLSRRQPSRYLTASCITPLSW